MPEAQLSKTALDAVRSGKCILFLGAGVHAAPPDPPAGQPAQYTYPVAERPCMGRELARRLAEESEFAAEFPGESLDDLQRVSLHMETRDGNIRKNLIDALIGHLVKGRKPSAALRMLAALPFRAIITTNFDPLLEEALSDHDKEPTVLVYDKRRHEPTRDFPEEATEKTPFVFKIHGSLEVPYRESIVITDEDYIQFIQRMSDPRPSYPIPPSLMTYIGKWPMLFVGYSLRDYNLRLLLRTLLWTIDPANRQLSFAVDYKPDKLIERVWGVGREKIVAFVAQDVWTLAPALYRAVHGKEYGA